ncbi:hypothetical protein WJX72_004590 [[Myrmecia] bisecta]|uniref:Pentatricopeptide repeat-containing protein n=1 Tax=[Myrmecia] bisecta TaxID=41462 RepID=A0AAW1PQ14_9CHLO
MGQAQAGRGEGPPGERGQGYRKLWQQVTKVERGQKLGEHASGVPFCDMTVEDLLRIICSLTPEESAVKAVSRGLYYLDSRALAALLKELAKAGLSNRASELFDWLRQLNEGHELAVLCDVYTYTTIISQCGSHQQLRKALELVAEMRSRGIQCNVHTYSALMNVCIKANELDLALDVYNQLMREGCTPNLVTYNILIDVHGKTGQWQEAMKVLDALDGQGVKPEVRTYNTIINACNRSGQPEYALKVYERMLKDGAVPTATTYTALISSYGKTGKVEEALQIFHDMVSRGCERNVITYSSLISACEKAGRWELALELFDEMHRDGCKPNVVTYNALIAACGQAGQWQPAIDILEQMGPRGCKPDAVTFGTLIAALDKANQWGKALKALDDMQMQGHRLDAAILNLIMDVLMRSGVTAATTRAVQLFHVAHRQGQLRMMSQGSTDTTVIAFTIGTSVLALLQWFLDLRLRAAKTGFAVGSAERPGLLLLKGKHTRIDGPNSTREAVTAILTATNAPATTAITPQGLRVEFDLGSAVHWFDSPEFDLLVSPLLTNAPRKLTEVILSEDTATATRCMTAFSAVKEFEDSHPLGAGKASGEVDMDAAVKRREGIGMLITLGRTLGFQEQTQHDSIQLMDRLTSLGLLTNDVMLPLVAAAVTLIAGRQGERRDKIPSDEVVAHVTRLSAQAVSEMEANIRTALHNDTGAICALRILHLYLERLGCDFQDPKARHRLAGPAMTLMAEAVFVPTFLQYRPSLVAAAVLYTARRAQGTYPFWPAALGMLTGYTDPLQGEFAACVSAAGELLRLRSPSGHLDLPMLSPRSLGSPSMGGLGSPNPNMRSPGSGPMVGSPLVSSGGFSVTAATPGPGPMITHNGSPNHMLSRTSSSTLGSMRVQQSPVGPNPNAALSRAHSTTL